MLSLFALLGVFGLSAGLGATAFDYQELNHHANLVVDSQKLQPKLVSYDDANYQITFTVDELTNYSFKNFNDSIVDNQLQDFVVSASYGGVSFSGVYSSYEGIYADISLTGSGGVQMAFNYGFDGGFIQGNGANRFTYLYQGGVETFSSNLVIVFDEGDYSVIKSAIELDVQANTPFDGGAVATDIVTTLVGGITGIATGLGAGVSALVSDIFINNGTLSVFGYIVVIFAGIALAIGLSRWVMNFLTSLGAKK